MQESWNKLTDNPLPAVVPIVREFYVNVIGREDSMSIVKGKRVNYSQARINVYFELNNVDDSDYQANLNWPILVDLVTSFIAAGEAIWTCHSDGKPRILKGEFLSEKAKGLHKFISAQLMPSGHTSKVSWDRAVLIYTILKGGSIDIDGIINNQIKNAIRGSRTSSYCFPNLITELCRESRVMWPEGLEILPARPMISNQRTTKRAPVMRDTSRVRVVRGAPAVEEGEPSRHDVSSKDAVIEGRNESIEILQAMHCESRQYHGWMTSVMREMAMQSGVNPNRIPPWPPISLSPPDHMDHD